MKTLVLCRHAKSSWDYPDLTDFERPLNRRGHRDAEMMGKMLKERGFCPGTILSSPANRALTTARMIARELEYPLERIDIRESLYDAVPSEIVETAASADDRYGIAMLFSHNPGLTGTVNLLTGESFDEVPTCGIAAVVFEIDSWSALPGAKGSLLFYEYPKKHRPVS